MPSLTDYTHVYFPTFALSCSPDSYIQCLLLTYMWGLAGMSQVTCLNKTAGREQGDLISEAPGVGESEKTAFLPSGLSILSSPSSTAVSPDLRFGPNGVPLCVTWKVWEGG